MAQQKTAVIILDGWAHGPKNSEINAVEKANTPFVDQLYEQYPNAELKTSGEDVGLPEGQMGNSEVGHLNIGAGRIVYQPLVRINKAIEDKSLHENEVLKNAIQYAKTHKKKIHLLGLVSDGGVHSHINHLKGLCDIVKSCNYHDLYIHAFTDGRDTDPKSGVGYIQALQQYLKKSTGRIASIIGRYFAMDRDNRWERVKKAYDLLVKGKGKKYREATKAIMESYEQGTTDEFIDPIALTNEDDQPVATIDKGDVVIFFNFRTDRGRELTMVLTQKDFPDYGMQTLDLKYLTMTQYDKNFEDIEVILDNEAPVNTLGEVIANQGLTQLRIAETEKYPHVTYFFSGGREKQFSGEFRKMIPSPKVSTYDHKPSMSADYVTKEFIQEVNENEPDFIILNFANPDMVGHTGVFNAVVEALETVDACLKQVIEVLQAHNYECLVTADHGNADFMVNQDGTPNTAHTNNPVPIFLLTGNKELKINEGKLADIAPTVLQLMEWEVPSEMTGTSLLSKQVETKH